ncbi:MAG TPA: NAD(P)-binding domain-containing protein, partial [Burkholderiaceae bacterium]|nr:NAD(P)-binding domain-containing protein [Burkholderiaceae bacterium]
MKIAFLGTGLMGSGFVRHLLANGEEVAVWNRSPDKALALEAHGARAFGDAAQAIAGADRIHLALSDDTAVDGVLEPLAAAMPEACWIVDHTTTAVTPTAARVARWNARHRVFVHAPVFMAPANALEGTGLMLVSGEPARHDALLSALQKMTGSVIYLGAAPERAAAFKLFGNLTLLGLLGVLADVNRLAHAVGIPAEEAFSLFKHFNPGQFLPVRAAKIAAGPYSPPSFEVAMARKDVRLMIEEAARGGIDLCVMPGVAALFDAAPQKYLPQFGGYC